MNFLNTTNKKIAGGVIVVLILISGFLIFGGKTAPKKQDVVQDSTVQKISAEKLGLTLTASPDKKKVKFSIEHPDGIKSIEYSLTYEADSTAQEQSEGGEARVQRGITGDAKIESDTKLYESEFLDLGSCSKNVCRYDSGVKSVSITLKIVKSDGKTYEAEKTSDL